MVGEGSIKIIDLEKDSFPLDLERSKVVLFVWVVGFAEIIKDRDGLDDPVQGFLTESGDAWGDDGAAAEEVLA
jgi:hypothetical protein